MNQKIVGVVVAAVVVAGLAAIIVKKSQGGGDNFSYTLGHEYAMNLKRQNVEVDVKQFLQGAEDVLKNNKSRLTEDEMRQTLIEHQKVFDSQMAEKAKVNKEAGQKWLAQYRSGEG